MPTALTIAGLDPTGAAGLVADLKTFHQLGVVGLAVATLVSAQSRLGVSRVVAVDAALVGDQLRGVLSDGRPDSVKTGALASVAIVREVAARLRNAGVAPIVDPVIASSSGHALLENAGRVALLDALVPGAALVTPNALEAGILTERPVTDAESALRAAEALLAYGAQAVLVKGGHLDGPMAVDLLVTETGCVSFAAERRERRDVRGTGCTLSAAIAALLAVGVPLPRAVDLAKRWLTSAIDRAPACDGRGPLDHFAPFPPPTGARPL